VGASTTRRRRRRGPRPVDRAHLRRFCERCGSNLTNAVNAPPRLGTTLCSWCESTYRALLRGPNFKDYRRLLKSIGA
jgi:hypothetical protein